MRKCIYLILLSLILSCTSKSKKAAPEARILAMDELKITLDDAGTPQRIEGAIMQLKHPDDPVEELYALVEQEPLFKLSTPEKELVLVQKEKDELGYQHLTFARVHNNIKIWGDEIKFHLNDKNEAYLMNGHYQASLPEDFSTATTLTRTEAEDAAKQALSFNYANQDETKLYIYPSDSGYHLAWRVIVGKARLAPDQWECLVDAQSGEILHKSSLIRTN
ncbi:hypothetical protein EH223_08270 [candidate division KSB1 bacterium]|nr:PepSY domain-containing protein [candidate division KSB1 bacterium]RQW04186.1 MAG: hypothetical protein EH223_08270 [candidate division KSB1 bacterium]